jgi:hypothetical protein
MNRASNSWSHVPVSGFPPEYAFDATIDGTSGRMFFPQGHSQSNRLEMNVLFARMTGTAGVGIESEKRWTTDKEHFFGTGHRNVGFTERNEPEKRGWINLGLGIMDGSELYIPFCADGFTYVNKYTSTRGPNADGVFRSVDSGSTWQVERISEFEAFNPSVCRTKGYCYYFACGGMGMERRFVLWFSRKPIEGSSWDAPKAVTKTVAYGVHERHSAVTEGDAIHICWLDSRHEKRTWNFAHPHRENYEVAYCQRKDSDTNWRKDIILSGGVVFSYSPSISVEGNKIAVAWGGAQTAHAWAFEGDPSDIYYTTSKDGGKTWARPLKVTDGAKDGITSGCPHVAVQKGIIHLCYAQGKWDRHTQVRDQGGWPIYYQQRPFPD